MRTKLPPTVVGHRFNRLTATAPTYMKDGVRFGEWRCDCGTVLILRDCNVRNGHTKSCGCFRAEKIANVGRAASKHGLSKTTEYRAWRRMLDRCEDPKHASWHNYGGRGITVSPEWHDFNTYRNDMGPRPSPRHSLERIDNDKGYSAANCRWATATEQARNRRPTVYLYINGEAIPLPEAAERFGIPRHTLWDRVKNYGMSDLEAVTRPVRRKANAQSCPSA